jgi:hypothetical protein
MKKLFVFRKHLRTVLHPFALSFHGYLYLIHSSDFFPLQQQFLILSIISASRNMEINTRNSVYSNYSLQREKCKFSFNSETLYRSYLQNGDRLSVTYHLTYHLSPPNLINASCKQEYHSEVTSVSCLVTICFKAKKL